MGSDDKQSLGELGKVVQDNLKNVDGNGATDKQKKFAADALGKLEKSDNKDQSKLAKEVLGKFEGSSEADKSK